MSRSILLPAIIAFVLLSGTGCERSPQKEAQEKEREKPEIVAGKKAQTEEKARPGMGDVEACGDGEVVGGVTSVRPPPGEEPDDGDMLVRRLGAEPATLNPIIATDAAEKSVNYHLVIDTLLSQDLDTGGLKPRLAKSWNTADDNVTFTFHLREDVTFHDGHPMTAEDVLYSIERVLDPDVDAASLRTYFIDCESYKKLDDYTVRIKWKEPYFKAVETIGIDLPIVPRHVLDNGADFNKHPYARKPVGTGPYKFVEWETGRRILLERYEGYWGKRPHFERMLYKIITNDDVALSLLKKGELDMVGLRRVQWLRQTNSSEFRSRFNKLHFHYPSYSYIGWNMRKPLFQDKRIRLAMTMLLNRPAMLKEIYYCLGSIATGPYDYKGPFSDPDVAPWPYDPERARELLSEAGWKDTDGDGVIDKDGKPFHFELSFTAAVPEWEQMAVMYKEDLKKAGIEMTIRKLEWAVFLANVQQWKFDACAMAWALDANPDSYQLWHSSQADIKASSNHVGFKSDEVDRLIELNRREFSKQKRIQHCRKIHRILHREQPYTFFITGESLAAFDKRIHNVIPHPIRPIFHYTKWYVPSSQQKYRSPPSP